MFRYFFALISPENTNIYQNLRLKYVKKEQNYKLQAVKLRCA